MNTVKLELSGNRVSTILIGETVNNLDDYIGERKYVIVIDRNVYRYHSHRIPREAKIVQITATEAGKNLSEIDRLVKQFIQLNVDRSWLVLGIGGGITCDMVGFAASIYMRGLSFAFVSTTLLSQADASVGGKNGVNYDKYKNMLGTINHPEFVVCDVSLLDSLSLREIRTGIVEIVKAGIIAEPELFEYIEQHVEQIEDLKRDVLIEILTRGVKIKAGVVRSDERERDERRKLNLGHTFGHAIERYEECTHGQAVSIGMAISADISQRLGLLSAGDCTRIKALLQRFRLPITTELKTKYMMEAVAHDKKREDDVIHYVLIRGIGEVEIRAFKYNELEALLTSIDSCA